MDNYTSYEQAYKNGYAAGFKAAKDESKTHVLSLDELREATDYPVYLEAPHEFPCGYEDYVLLSRFESETVVFILFGEEEGMRLPISDYGKTWRVWNQKPSNILKMHTPWDH